MFSIAVLDDDKAYLDEIISMTRRCPEISEDRWQISSYTDEEQLFKDAVKGGFSMYLLDVVLSDTTGIELARRLRMADPDAVVIFISSSLDYAAESYDVKAFYYLIKPVSEDKFFPVLKSAAELVKKRQNSLFIKTPDGTERLSIDDICYAELRSRRPRYVCKERVVTGLQLTHSFRDEVLPLLLDDRFFPCGASLVINLSEVSSVQQDAVLLTTGETIYVPVKSKHTLSEAWADYWLNGGRSR